MELEIEPINNFVAIRPLPPENMVGGLIIVSKNPPQKGVVIGIGDTVTKVKKNDLVLIPAYIPCEVQVGDDKIKILDQGMILAILKKAL